MPTKIKKTRKGSLLSLQDPSFVSLVGQPANRAGFKVFRGDNANQLRASLDAQLEKVLQRKDINPDFTVHTIMLPEDIKSREEAELIRSTFGFDADFTLGEEEGRFVLVSDSAPQGEDSITVELGDGFEARLVRADQQEEEKMPGISLVALRFDPDKFIDPDKIQRWLKENEIDCKSEPVDTGDYLEVSVLEVARSDRELGFAAVEDGVQAVVTPSEEFNLPGKTVNVRNYVYGNYGWGATNFDVAVADKTFSRWMDDAIYALRDVLEEVAFYAAPEERTPEHLAQNVSRVCLQFASAVSNMAATLPRPVENSDKAGETQIQKEEGTMPKAEGQKPEEEAVKAETSDTTETRSDEQTAAGAADGETGTTEETTSNETVTEETAQAVTTSDEKPPVEDKLAEMFGTLSASLETLTDSVKSLREDQKTLKADMDKVKQSVEEMGDATVVRGDLADPDPTKRSDNGKNEDSVFEGVIFRRS